MIEASTVFESSAIEFIKNVISNNNGCEVLFQAVYVKDKKISEIQVISRGNLTSAPAKLSIKQPFNLVIHNHPTGELSPSDPDIEIASFLLNQEIAFLIIDNNVKNVNIVVESSVIDPVVKLDKKEISEFYEKEGKLSTLFPEFEYRESQKFMAEEVSKAFNEDLHSIIEASTGTGKSIAYLIPLALWVLANGKRGLVCTNTINLQQQLMDKDIPLLRKVLKRDIKVVLVKGRQNYLCIKKIHEAGEFQSYLFDDSETEELERIISWVDQTKTGSKTELTAAVSEKVWEKLASDSETCQGIKCPHNSDCFFRKARKEAVDANILIANHSIFFADMAVRGDQGKDAAYSVFPYCDRVVLDEAHNIEDAATSYFGESLSRFGIAKTLSRLFIKHRGGVEKGILKLIVNNMEKPRNFGKKNTAEISDIIKNQIIKKISELNKDSVNFFEKLYEYFQSINGSSNLFSLRITKKIKDLPVYDDEIMLLLKELKKSIKRLASLLTKLYELSIDLEKEISRSTEAFFLQVMSHSNKLNSMAGFLNNFIDFSSEEENVIWVEGRRWKNKYHLSFFLAPLNVSSILYKYFYEKYQGVVYTSATLSVDSSFNFFEKRVGLNLLEEEKKSKIILPGVFDYQSHSMLGLPADFPDQNSPDFIHHVADFALNLISVTGGRLFFLFTSRKMMDECYEQTMSLLPAKFRDSCLKQGQMQRHFLLEEFKSRKNAVLFAVNSFWEGVDVRGDNLIGVVIVKLPFLVPTDPVHQARTELIEKNGESSFFTYSLPHAVLRLKQGFGRLIRTRQDYGAVFILDNRILKKSYGRIFLKSLPNSKRVIENSKTVEKSYSAFLERFE